MPTTQKLIPLIEASALLKLRKNPELILIDASQGKGAQENYEKKHLDGALRIDLNKHLSNIKENAADGGRHPLPELDDFATTLGNFGIAENSHVVIYDDKNGANSAARLWWMLKAIGHQKVQVLNGGMEQAEKIGFPTNSAVVQAKPVGKYAATQWKLPLADMDEVERHSEDEDFLVIDVREAGRYAGEFEPIDLIAGHIPGAINVPFTTNLNDDGLFLSQDELKDKYQEIAKGKKSENIMVHCGSGVTACHTLLSMDYAGLEMPKLYVGSWSEWSRNEKIMTLKKD